MGKVIVDDDLMPKEEDLLYEEELLRTPHVMRLWWRYLEARKDATTKRRYLIYERAVRALPGSYKVRETPAAIRGSSEKLSFFFVFFAACLSGLVARAAGGRGRFGNLFFFTRAQVKVPL